MTTVLGTCSCCGGRVTVPTVWHGVVPPVPTCESCGATKRESGPVIDMEPRRDGQTLTDSINNVRLAWGNRSVKQ